MYTQKGLAMGASTSSVLSELYIQYFEHTTLSEILLRHRIVGYYRYVDDIFLVYDSSVTNIHDVLQYFNTATPTLRFTLEEETDNKLTSSTSPYYVTLTVHISTCTGNPLPQTQLFQQIHATQKSTNRAQSSS
jgi:hypothetical protein